MDAINSYFFTKRRVILACTGATILLGIIYIELTQVQTTGIVIGDRIKAVYFAIKNTVFSEPEGLKAYNALTEHAIYQKFKSMYPDSTDDFGMSTDGTPILRVEQYDSHGNRMYLQILRGDDVLPFYYSVHCKNSKSQGVPFEAAFDFLDDVKCLQD